MTYEVVVYFDADSDVHADDLFDAVCDALGCSDDRDHECPHFRLGFGPLVVPDSRRSALRYLRGRLVEALRVMVKGNA